MIVLTGAGLIVAIAGLLVIVGLLAQLLDQSW